MRVLFARHGETEWNAKKWIQGSTDIELNETGIQQAHALAEALKEEQITCVYTSALKRAANTAKIVAESKQIPWVKKKGLEEICFGDWEGHTWYDVKCGWDEIYEAWKAERRTFRPPQGETYAELIDRLIAAVWEIIREAKDDVLIVTHSACIQIIMAEMNGTPIANMAKDYPIPNAQAVAIDAQMIIDKFDLK